MDPLVIRVRDLEQDKERTFAFERSPVRIGRNRFNTLVINSPYVSQWQGVVAFDKRSTTYYGMSAVNSTLADGREIVRGEPVELEHAGELRVGPLIFSITREPAAPDALTTSTHTLSETAVADLSAQLGAPIDIESIDQTRVWTPTQEQELSDLAVSTLHWRTPPDDDGDKTVVFDRSVLMSGPDAMSGELSESDEPDDVTVHFRRRQLAVPPPPPAATPRSKTRSNRGTSDTKTFMSTLRANAEEYRAAANKLFDTLADELSAMGDERRRRVLRKIRLAQPELERDPRFQDTLRRLEMADEALTPDQAARQALEWLARTYVGERACPTGIVELGRFVARIGRMLELSSQAFVGLREMSNKTASSLDIPTVASSHKLGFAQDASAVLSYVLDWRDRGGERLRAMDSAYKDIMSHQAGVLMGLVEGARNMLQRLGPKHIDRELARKPVRIGQLTVPRRYWPFRTRDRWNHYRRRHRELLKNESEFSAELFGSRFMSVYAALGGVKYRPALLRNAQARANRRSA